MHKVNFIRFNHIYISNGLNRSELVKGWLLFNSFENFIDLRLLFINLLLNKHKFILTPTNEVDGCDTPLMLVQNMNNRNFDALKHN